MGDVICSGSVVILVQKVMDYGCDWWVGRGEEEKKGFRKCNRDR